MLFQNLDDVITRILKCQLVTLHQLLGLCNIISGKLVDKQVPVQNPWLLTHREAIKDQEEKIRLVKRISHYKNVNYEWPRN